MLRLVVRIALSALAFTTLLPMIHGIDFHGNFVTAISLSVMFAIMLWAVERLAIAVSALFAIGTLGLALLVLIPLWIIGYWFLPAVTLMLLAGIMPDHLTVSGWAPAFWAGLVMLAVGMLTSKPIWRQGKGAAKL